MYVCNVAADIYGKKHNIKLKLTKTPSYDELCNYIESHFDVTVRSTRPEGYLDVPFKIHVIKLYDQILLRWVELYSTAQLTQGCQLYAFQPENTWHSEMQGHIPKCKPVVAWFSEYGATRRKRGPRVARDSDTPPSRVSKMRSVFGDVDIGGKGFILLSDLRACMRKLDIKLLEGDMETLFRRADSSCDGHLSFEEWCTFCQLYPSLLDALFFRACPVWNDGTAKLAANEELLALRRMRERELQGVRSKRAAWQQRTYNEKLLETQRKEAELARLHAEIATIKEHSALDDLFYTPTEKRA